ncbi:LETM1-like protein-domain-containing protein [Fimicolochytrium jonesii]|uniref:LETM1-like protein-domain-containing protein n=1 Tax=Fimicolochytrium jonesii TaxID=1396493 RepID=UPI0022FEDB80|nr:LETM1-like protein-domain-containing protein [Fimicolochytrium jonesii]KAI8822125.1 LETM1-like protein-domain-containing protein [Fimicolochytrium jonesii]
MFSYRMGLSSRPDAAISRHVATAVGRALRANAVSIGRTSPFAREAAFYAQHQTRGPASVRTFASSVRVESIPRGDRSSASQISSLFTIPTSLRLLREPETVAPVGQSQAHKQETPVEKAIREAKSEQLAAASNALGPTTEGAAVPVQSAPKKSISVRIKEELLHYWHGTKLLGTEIKISSRLLVKLLNGQGLSRREHRQLKRTTSDLLRLVPFIIILLIPFMELALPILLKLFPNMLPSTFESKFQEEEKKKKILKMRLEMARFLQDTVEDVTVSGSSAAAAAKEFTEFFNKCRTSAQPASSEEILRIAKKFPDELTLSNLSRPQLVSMAKYMNIQAFGTDSFLRHQIQRRLNYLEQDDRVIIAEGGAEKLSLPELQQVCISRGIRTTGVSPARMRAELEQWLDLHVNHNISSSLLILSRAFQLSDRIPTDKDAALKGNAEALQATLSSLPHQVVNEAQLHISEAEGSATYKQRLSVLQEQEELIQDELEQEAAIAEAKKAKEEEEAALKRAKEEQEAAEQLPLVEQVRTRQTEHQAQTIIEEEDALHMTDEELTRLSQVLKVITNPSAVDDIRAPLAQLKEERREYKEHLTQPLKDVEELKQVTQKETAKSTNEIGDRIDKMVSRLEADCAKYDLEHGSNLNLVRPDSQGKITIAELEQAIQLIRDHPDDERIKRIVMKLDADGDGVVAMSEILFLAEEAEKEGHGETAGAIKRVAARGKKVAEEAVEQIREIQHNVAVDELAAMHEATKVEDEDTPKPSIAIPAPKPAATSEKTGP